MKVATAKRGDVWLAQIVHIGDGLHWEEHQKIQKEVHKWVKEYTPNCEISGWQFFFTNEKDLHWFLLRWHN